MLKAEFKSREIVSPHEGHLCNLIFNDFSTTLPHSEHSCVVPLGSTQTNLHPVSSTLYVSNSLNLFQEASLIDNCKYLLFISDTFKSSIAINEYDFANLRVSLCRKSNLWFVTFSYNLVNFNLDLYLLEEPFCFFDSCLDFNLNLSNDSLKYLGLSISNPFDNVANLINPTSIPI